MARGIRPTTGLRPWPSSEQVVATSRAALLEIDGNPWTAPVPGVCSSAYRGASTASADAMAQLHDIPSFKLWARRAM